MSKFDAAIDVLNQRKLALMCGLDEGDDEAIIAAIRLLEAAGKVDKNDMMDWLERVHTYQSVPSITGKQDIPDHKRDFRHKDAIRTLLSALPED